MEARRIQAAAMSVYPAYRRVDSMEVWLSCGPRMVSLMWPARAWAVGSGRVSDIQHVRVCEFSPLCGLPCLRIYGISARRLSVLIVADRFCAVTVWSRRK